MCAECENSTYLTDRIRILGDNLLGPGLKFWWAGCVLIRSGCFPASLFERELNSDGFPSHTHNVRAGLHACVFVKGCWFVHFRVPESVRIVQGSAGVHTRLRTRFGASIDSGTERVLAWSCHGTAHGTFALVALLVCGSGELAGRGSRGGSVLHLVQNFN